MKTELLETDQGAAALIQHLTLAALGVQTIAGVPHLLVPDGPDRAALRSFEHMLSAPSTVRGAVTLHDEKSFSTYVRCNAGPGTVLFASLDHRAVTAVFDWHTPRASSSDAQAAGWGLHRATLPAKLTDPWKRWTGANKQAMAQRAFATFLEDNLEDIAEPNGSMLLEIAKKFDLGKNVTFRSAVNLDNGLVQFTYNEEERPTDTVSVPRTFVLGLAPFEGADPYRVTARLRYRVDDQKLGIWFDLKNPDVIVEDAFRARVKAIAEHTGLQPLWGEAPAPVQPR
jgi:uncharacterized protein YfdQ (DUF2303 family)